MTTLKHAFEPEEVMAYLDGELEPQRAAALALHLEQCAECQFLARQIRQLSERLLNFQVEPAPAGIPQSVSAALEKQNQRTICPPDAKYSKRPFWRQRFRRPAGWVLAGGLATLLLATLGVLNLSRSTGRFTESSPLTGLVASRTATLPQSYDKELAYDASAGEREARPVVMGAEGELQAGELAAPQASGPMIAGTATLNVTAKNYEEASKAIEALVAARGGYIEKLNAKAEANQSRELEATLRVPAKQLDALLAELRKLGHVEEESRTNEEVTAQYVDLEAHLRSARATEERLIQLLGNRTGKLSDVLEAERELARIRGEIEAMQGSRDVLLHRVSFATVQIRLGEEYREYLHARPTSAGTKIWNAMVEGLRNLEDGAVGLVVFLSAYGPSIVFWLAVLAFPAWLIWRRVRARRMRETKLATS